MTTTFETARIGDKGWSIECGWGEIRSLDGGETYPIIVEFQDGRTLSYTLEGRRLTTHELQTLYWDEVKIVAPQKPLPDLEVDTKVLVWTDPNKKNRRHFSHFSHGRIYTFDGGSTSFTKPHSKSVTGWNHWELAE